MTPSGVWIDFFWLYLERTFQILSKRNPNLEQENPMTIECKLTLSPQTLDNSDPKARVQADQDRRSQMTQTTCGIDMAVSTLERTEDLKDIGQRYRFERLVPSIVFRDLYFNKDDPGPGDRVPEFSLPTVNGGRFKSSDLAATGPALLIFGSSTCPLTDNAAPGLNELYCRFGDRVRFVMVNVREAHPGKAFPQPGTLDVKMAHAKRLRDLHGFEFEVAVDDVDGTLHRALSPKPNSAYILGTDGTILFRAHWANDTKALAAALDSIVAGESPRRSQSGGLVKPMLRMLPNIATVLDRAGGGAWADMWRVAPPLAAIALALKALRVRSRRPEPALSRTIVDDAVQHLK
jgi:thiol-disulfide isomerase/thioredoxin